MSNKPQIIVGGEMSMKEAVRRLLASAVIHLTAHPEANAGPELIPFGKKKAQWKSEQNRIGKQKRK